MKYNAYSKTTKNASRIGFGAWQLGNDEFWGKMSYDEGISLVKEAYENGLTFFDTAPGYANGKSEMILGEALKDVRDKVIINTKIGHRADGTSDFSVNSLESQIEESLSRLKTTYIDSVLLHNPSMEILSGKTNHFKELKRLKDKKLINAYGVSIDTYDELKTTIESGEVEVIELLFNVFFQSPIDLFKAAKTKGISIVIKVPLDSGWLTGKYDSNSRFTGIRSRWSEEVIKRRGELVSELKRITNSYNITKYSIAFILSFSEITTVIIGVKNKKQLIENISYESFSINPQIKKEFINLYNKKIKPDPLPW